MSKPKLLITLGCSFTEGVGAYELTKDISKFKEPVNQIKDVDSLAFYTKNRLRFHNLGWPAKLQKKLKYDKLINMGSGGSGHSFQAKKFFEWIENNNTLSQEYDVLVLWAMTFPERFSFYRKGKLQSIIPGIEVSQKEIVILGDAYSNFTVIPEYDAILEQLFYLKVIETACKAHSFNFLYATLFASRTNEKISYADILEKFQKNSNFLNLYAKETREWEEIYKEHFKIYHDIDYFRKSFLPPALPYFQSPICKHPNENGYEYISDRFYEVIKCFFPHLVGEKNPDIYENIYLGVQDWSPYISKVRGML